MCSSFPPLLGKPAPRWSSASSTLIGTTLVLALVF
jgi:hypothetical protein